MIAVLSLPFSRKVFPVVAMTAGLVLSACSPPAGDGSNAATKVAFSEFKPLLETHCIRCHNTKSVFGGLVLENRAKAFAGGSRGPSIKPGDAAGSLFYQVLDLPADQYHAMPATGPKLNAAEKKLVHDWIQSGADWPEGPEGQIKAIATVPSDNI
ncbi:MAG TPA: hypothetical protein P5016_00565 [Verrucomicrobiales bacterium]|nr:hypothetical protein [Verrucomicrobiae bacterium]MCP5555227.1 hypothetical protein [Akkermansiaceae bacterium]HRX52962.1 hypothetical protein [Verrucomicrobiales bacterium]